MRFRRAVATVATALTLAVGVPPATATFSAADPSTWSNRQLAAQLVVAGVSMSNLSSAETWVRAGLGGIVLLGSPPSDIGVRLARVRAAYPIPPFVGSDEEGGAVQRLSSVIYPLPSAEHMGAAWTTAKVQATAFDYGLRMRALGVDLALAPVADLAVPGYYIEQRDRAFSAEPNRAGSYVSAWWAGLRGAHVAGVVKHWPGHGEASDTHTGSTTTPPLSTLEQRDLLPFAAATRAGVPAVMVGHLNVPGLTEPGTPATLSPAAMRYLRSRAGASALILTDSLSMGAITALRLSSAAASVRALRAGADVALLTDDPMAAVDAITHALDTGDYARSAAIASARRVLALKRFTDAAPVAVSAPVAAPSGDGALLVAHRVVDGSVVVRRVAGTTWGRPVHVGGRTVSTPAVARAGNTTYVFVRGIDNYVYHRAGTTGSGWTAWSRLNTGSLVDGPAAVGTRDGAVHLAVRTRYNRLVVRTFTPGTGWSRNLDIGTTTVSPAVTETPSGEVVVVARNDASRVVVRSMLPRAEAPWQPWTSLGGVTTAPPAVATDPLSGTVVIAMRGPDGRVYANHRVGTSWRGWSSLGAVVSAAPGLAPVKDGTIALVIRAGAANDLYTRGWTNGTWGAATHRWY